MNHYYLLSSRKQLNLNKHPYTHILHYDFINNLINIQLQLQGYLIIH